MTTVIARAPMTGKIFLDALETIEQTDLGRENQRRRLELHDILFDLDNCYDLMDKLADELAGLDDEATADVLERWFNWYEELTETKADLASAEAAIANFESVATGHPGWWLGATVHTLDRDVAADRLVELAGGPESEE